MWVLLLAACGAPEPPVEAPAPAEVAAPAPSVPRGAPGTISGSASFTSKAPIVDLAVSDSGLAVALMQARSPHLVAIAPDGSVAWERAAQEDGLIRAGGLAATSDGVLVVGDALEGGTVAKRYGPDGNPVASLTLPDVRVDLVQRVAGGGLVLAGVVDQKSEVGGHPVARAGGPDSFVAWMAPDGSFTGALGLGVEGPDRPTALVAGADGVAVLGISGPGDHAFVAGAAGPGATPWSTALPEGVVLTDLVGVQPIWVVGFQSGSLSPLAGARVLSVSSACAGGPGSFVARLDPRAARLDPILYPGAQVLAAAARDGDLVLAGHGLAEVVGRGMDAEGEVYELNCGEGPPLVVALGADGEETWRARVEQYPAAVALGPDGRLVVASTSTLVWVD